ncbi:hypothetical protein GCM10027047_01790 [Rhodococcus aerolatus]
MRHGPPAPDDNLGFLPSQLALDVGNALLLLSVVPLTIFVVLYVTRSRWRTLLAGRSLLYLSVALDAVLVQAAASVFLGVNYPLREEIRLVLYGSVLLAFVRMLQTLIRVQSGKATGILPDTDLTDSRARQED